MHVDSVPDLLLQEGFYPFYDGEYKRRDIDDVHGLQFDRISFLWGLKGLNIRIEIQKNFSLYN